MQFTVNVGTHIITDISSCNSAFDVALFRHPPVSMPAGSCYGRLDVGLEAGWEDGIEARVAVLAALRPACLWSSPAFRCTRVATLLSQRLGKAFALDNRLLEMNFGEWEGLRWDDVPRRLLDLWAADPIAFQPPGGESGAALIRRVEDFARMITRQSRSCVVISHGGPLRLLAACLRREKPDLLAEAPALGSLQLVRVTRDANDEL